MELSASLDEQPAPVRRALPAAGEAARVRLAASDTTPSGLLATLAEDPAVTVRAAVALNHAASASVNRTLALDHDERIRLLLVHKTAQVALGMDGTARDRLHERIAGALVILVRDEVLRVRAGLADVLKAMPEAPRELIVQLAHDAAVSVSEPIIRFSTLLTPEDLLALLAAPAHAMVATAVACRANLPLAVSDAVAATADTAAIRALLSNGTAAIREATLDALVAEAAHHVEWHEPLVRRPVLSARSARALSNIVVSDLLAVLAARADLDPALALDLRRKLTDQLAAPGRSHPRQDACAMDAARQLDKAGKLDEAALLTAARQGNEAMLAAMLAVASGLPLAVVDRAVSLRSAKAIVSLIWRAGLTMRVAAPLQLQLVGLSPAELLVGSPLDAFPLPVAEMRWQLRFLERLGR